MSDYFDLYDTETVEAAYINEDYIDINDLQFKIQRRNMRAGRYYHAIRQDLKPFLNPSVTTILDKTMATESWLIDWIAQHGKEKANELKNQAADFGTFEHIVFGNYHKERQVNLDSVPLMIQMFKAKNRIKYDTNKWIYRIKCDLIAYHQWCVDYDVTAIAIEIPLVSEIGYAGTIDLVCVMRYGSGVNGNLLQKDFDDKGNYIGEYVIAVVDWKSFRHAFDNKNVIQIAGYYINMWNENFPLLPAAKAFNWSPKNWINLKDPKPKYQFINQTDKADIRDVKDGIHKFNKWVAAEPKDIIDIKGRLEYKVNITHQLENKKLLTYLDDRFHQLDIQKAGRIQHGIQQESNKKTDMIVDDILKEEPEYIKETQKVMKMRCSIDTTSAKQTASQLLSKLGEYEAMEKIGINVESVTNSKTEAKMVNVVVNKREKELLNGKKLIIESILPVSENMADELIIKAEEKQYANNGLGQVIKKNDEEKTDHYDAMRYLNNGQVIKNNTGEKNNSGDILGINKETKEIESVNGEDVIKSGGPIDIPKENEPEMILENSYSPTFIPINFNNKISKVSLKSIILLMKANNNKKYTQEDVVDFKDYFTREKLVIPIYIIDKLYNKMKKIPEYKKEFDHYDSDIVIEKTAEKLNEELPIKKPIITITKEMFIEYAKTLIPGYEFDKIKILDDFNIKYPVKSPWTAKGLEIALSNFAKNNNLKFENTETDYMFIDENEDNSDNDIQVPDTEYKPEPETPKEQTLPVDFIEFCDRIKRNEPHEKYALFASFTTIHDFYAKHGPEPWTIKEFQNNLKEYCAISNCKYVLNKKENPNQHALTKWLYYYELANSSEIKTDIQEITDESNAVQDFLSQHKSKMQKLEDEL